MIEVKHTLTGAVLWSGETLSGAILRDANLRGADLSGANLRNADLRYANLSYANLTGANLRNADLTGANLRNADLSSANLTGANLTGADLSGADLRNADLRNAKLPTGETWEIYCAEVVPALLAAGGKPVPVESWSCHSWENCLVAAAFGVGSIAEVPALHRPRAEQLIQLFDAGLITREVCGL